MRTFPIRPLPAVSASLVSLSLLAVSCGTLGDDAEAEQSVDDNAAAQVSDSSVFDSANLHDFALDFDQDHYDEMVAIYLESSEKEWIEAAVTIDGTTYEKAGIRLKGNSSLRRLANGENGGFDEPSGVPWLIRLDKFVDGQNHEGINDFVVRSSGSETAINEAVSLELLAAAGLASQEAIAVRFVVNGDDDALRLVVEHPEDVWMANNFDSDDALYKAESTGDYSYRGEDEDAYDEVFDQEAGKSNADLSPLIEFLDFINNSDEATFEAELEQRFNVDAFATYLAMNDIVANIDDIDGPGNNSYLHWDAETGLFTIVPWDYNESFGWARGVQSGPATVATPDAIVEDQGSPPELGGQQIQPSFGFQAETTDVFQQRGGNQTGGGGGQTQSNILVERFTASPTYGPLYQEKLTELNATLIDSGDAEAFLSQWENLLLAEASELVGDDTIATEANYVRSYFN